MLSPRLYGKPQRPGCNTSIALKPELRTHEIPSELVASKNSSLASWKAAGATKSFPRKAAVSGIHPEAQIQTFIR